MDDSQTDQSHPPGNEVAAVFLLRADGAALLQHRDDKPGLARAGLWVPPGGHGDPGEPAEVCARRELYEETGYRCEHLQWLASVRDDPGPGHAAQLLHVFWAPYDGVQTVVCLEGQALEFIPREQATSHRVPEVMVSLWDRALALFNPTPA